MSRISVAAVMMTVGLVACGGGGDARTCDALWDKHLRGMGGNRYGLAVQANLRKVCPSLTPAELACLDQRGFERAWWQSPCCTAHLKLMAGQFGGESAATDSSRCERP
ncbi:MAG: hypothetical protein HS111_30240 [Kofleriaceae bacterium]|nr:hypothetical protein [Kofleriaceae bacterium]MCL4224606.1 hypothetical protein [Myxococcales bacterium]